MMGNPSLGYFVDRNTLRFDLRYDHPPAAVWRAITNPDALAVWLMPMTIDLRVGGKVTLRYTKREGMPLAEGVITELVAPSVFEYHFGKGAWDWPEGTLRFELERDGDGSKLSFTHRIAPDAAWFVDPDGQVGGPGTIHPGACAGWQGFFEEGLARFLDGRPAPLYDEADDELMAKRTELYKALIESSF